MISRRRYRRKKMGHVERDVLSQLTFGDLMISILMSGRSTKRMYEIARERAAKNQTIRRAVHRLEKRGYITPSGDMVSLTHIGRKSLEREIARLRQGVKSRKEWDGKWRLVAFDVPEVWRDSRSALRLVLKRARFHQLQRSVWVHPYECDELVFLLNEDRRLQRNVILIEATKLSGEDALMKKFGVGRGGARTSRRADIG